MMRRTGKHIALAAMVAALSGQAFAKDPREGTLACVVEEAWNFDPGTGSSGRWSGAPTSFILKVGTCAKVKAGVFEYNSPEFCDAYRTDGLVISTTLPGVGDYWAPASPFERLKEPDGTLLTLDGGVFDSASGWADSLNNIAPRLQLTSALRFNFIQGQEAKEGDKLRWWTLQGHCTPFAG